MQRQARPFGLLVGLTMMLGGGPPAVHFASAQPPAKAASPPATPEQVLQLTERFMRPAKSEEILALGQELLARGEESSARRVFAGIATTEADYERLVRQLLQLGQMSVVPELLKSWTRKFPRSLRPKVFQTVYFHATGEFELAHRELRGLSGKIPADLEPLCELQRALIELYLRGTPPGTESNPWNVRFVDEAGGYTAGKIDPAQAKRLPASALSASFELLALLPRQGNLWYLAGEVANATGNPQAALECFRRAEILQYAPKLVRDRRRVLEENQRQVRQASEAALSGIPQPAGNAATDVEPPAGWTNLAENPKMLVILGVGGVFVLWVLVLQIREWRRPRRR
jgi:tetratricopeptide (TPR) repeat protein